MITRLRIGHSKLNGTLCILGKHPTGLCDECQESVTFLCHAGNLPKKGKS